MYCLKIAVVILSVLAFTAEHGLAVTQGIWISKEELRQLPMSGGAWDALLSAANRSVNPNISNQDDKSDSYTFAKALVYARTGQISYKNEVVKAIGSAMETENGGRTLALGRNLIGYVLAADIIDLKNENSGLDSQFRSWLKNVRNENLSGRTLISTHDDRPNNWGTHAGASRIAVALYLDDKTDLAKGIDTFKGYLGDRSVYAGFKYGELSWQADESKPVGINPKGSTKNGHDIDGVLPDDQRRAGTFRWPPTKENYVYEALQGIVVMLNILERQGYSVTEWSDRAILRAYDWLHKPHFGGGSNYPAEGDDKCGPWVINWFYGTSFPASTPCGNFKSIGWMDWTHGPDRDSQISLPPPPTNLHIVK
jgi:hypothetical protein